MKTLALLITLFLAVPLGASDTRARVSASLALALALQEMADPPKAPPPVCYCSTECTCPCAGGKHPEKCTCKVEIRDP